MALWTPALLALDLWLDWADKSTITLDAQDNVSEWRDKSGNDNHAVQTTEAYRPSDNAEGSYSDSLTDYKFLAWPSIAALTAVWCTRYNASSGDYRHISNYWHGNAAISGLMFHPSYTPVTIRSGAARLDGSDISPLSVPRFQTQKILVMQPTSPQGVGDTGAGVGFANRCFYGMHSEIIISTQVLSASDIEKVEGYLAWKWGTEENLPVDHPYANEAPTDSSGDVVHVINALDQQYDFSGDAVLAALDQEYNLNFPVKNALTQIWANILEVSLNQHYGNADTILAALAQHYNDAPHILQALIQKYDDMMQLSVALVQKHNLMFKAETSLDQKWAVCGFQATAGLVQEWELRQRDEVIASLGQYWGLFRDRQDVQAPLFWVMADGVLLKPSEFTWTLATSAAAIECTVTLPDHSVWRSIQIRGSMEIMWSGILYEYFIEEKPRTRSISGKEFTAGYILKGLSVTAGLEAPYAIPITRSWPETTMASGVVADLADGVEIDWQIADFPVFGGTFNVNNQTPLTAIKALVGMDSVEAVVQTSHDGKLIVRREFPTSPTKWHETKADHIIQDDGGVFSDSDDRDVMPGYNYIEITDQEEADSSKRLEQEAISETSKLVRGYSVPWVDDFPLDTSGGEWVSISDNGVKTERIGEELVEFVDGAATLSQPFYDRDLDGKLYPLTIAWLLDDLGFVTAKEDGSLTCVTPGNSLAKISYLTKYREWTVRDQEIESVQVFIPGEEVAA